MNRERNNEMAKPDEIHIFNMPVKEALKKSGPYLIMAALTALFCTFFIDKIPKDTSHSYRLWLAGLGVVLLIYRLAVKGRSMAGNEANVPKSPDAKIYFGALTVAIVFGIFNYYNFNKKEAVSIGDGADMMYYYLNTKYLDELGYFSLYAAQLTADREFNNRYASKVKKYRDLRDYEIKSTRVAFEHGKEIKEKQFSKERWEAFKHDVDYFMALPEMGHLYDYIFSDHGYNPPPTWAVPGYALAAFVPVEYVKVIAMVDVLAVIGMLVAIVWAFNLETMMFVMLFFLSTFSGRWPMLGQCLLRFDWSSALVIGICFLKKERWATAGAFLAYAAFNRIFPAIFFFPWVVVAALDVIRTKKLPVYHIRLAAGAAAVSVFLVVSAAGLFGVNRFQESKENLLMHNKSFSSHRIGLADLFVFDGETTKAELRAAGGLHAKEQKVQATKKLRDVIGLMTLAFIAYYIYRVKRPLHELIHLSAIPLFCMTAPQVNYYNLRIILVVWHMFNLKESLFHRIGIIALFAIEVVAQYSHVSGNERFATNSYTSYGLFFYYLYVMAWMLTEIRKNPNSAPKPIQ